MKLKNFAVYAAFAVSLFAGSSFAGESFTPIGFGMVEGPQFPPRDWSVYGLRVSLLGCGNKRMVGIAVSGIGNDDASRSNVVGGFQAAGLFNRAADAMLGLHQVAAIANDINDDGCGFQVAGVYNSARDWFAGMQVAFFNESRGEMMGMQCGFINNAEEFYGMQIGFFNKAKRLYGLQLGVVNTGGRGDVVLPVLRIGW